MAAEIVDCKSGTIAFSLGDGEKAAIGGYVVRSLEEIAEGKAAIDAMVSALKANGGYGPPATPLSGQPDET